MAADFFTPPQHASQYDLPKKLIGIHWLFYDSTVPLLNSVKILTVQSVENFKILEPTSIWSDCLLACLPCHKTH